MRAHTLSILANFQIVDSWTFINDGQIRTARFPNGSELFSIWFVKIAFKSIECRKSHEKSQHKMCLSHRKAYLFSISREFAFFTASHVCVCALCCKLACLLNIYRNCIRLGACNWQSKYPFDCLILILMARTQEWNTFSTWMPRWMTAAKKHVMKWASWLNNTQHTTRQFGKH